jgi:hypothetical protein
MKFFSFARTTVTGTLFAAPRWKRAALSCTERENASEDFSFAARNEKLRLRFV